MSLFGVTIIAHGVAIYYIPGHQILSFLTVMLGGGLYILGYPKGRP